MSTAAGTAFGTTFGRPPETAWHAPGRVNLVGEHTDYNGGLALPIALPYGVGAAVGARPGAGLRVASTAPGTEAVSFAPDELEPGRAGGWAAYVAGAVWALRRHGLPATGLDVHLDADLPQGAGLSSSAAVVCAVLGALDARFGLGLGPRRLVAVGHQVENEFLGVPTGALDESASLLCRAGQALLIDFRSGATRQVPFDPASSGLTLLVIDTRAGHRLADGEYARRRADCERAAALLGLPTLRDVDPDALADVAARLPGDRLRRRVRHVVTENARVGKFVAALCAGPGGAPDPGALGRVMLASHASLRDDYEVSCPELDVAVEAACAAGAYGARLTGGGFGGSAIALCPSGLREQVAGAVETAFEACRFRAPQVLSGQASAGAGPE